jgi:hypothetical protein
MKNSNDTIGNRTRDLTACNVMPQPTASPRFVSRGPVIKRLPLTEFIKCKKITIIEFSDIRLGNLKFVERRQSNFAFKIFTFRPIFCPFVSDTRSCCIIRGRPLPVTPMILQINKSMLNKPGLYYRYNKRQPNLFVPFHSPS